MVATAHQETQECAIHRSAPDPQNIARRVFLLGRFLGSLWH